ncbi:unnamed protein product [Cylindrotheca closterium]|uniref:Uncharacterized protein n=1 Tax=Cylindrotheca closterium TaxID=2856 RepID=A0AAD2CUQ2_9STRA|nr:unnamed protein product [Cylindrotheca closterium]
MIRKSISTTLRLTADIWLREGGVQQLYPASALRIVDHHLHASGIIEHSKESLDRLYDHDWFCVSQAVTCFDVEDLLVKSLDDQDFASHSFIFVMGVGSSSIQFGNVITLNDEVLATTRRIFCRKEPSGKSAPFTDEEKSRFLESQPPELLYSMPEVEKFGSFLPGSEENLTPVLTVNVGPQHVNMGNHADHAFLVETAIHAMSLADKDISSVAVNYVSEAKLGHTLECLFHSDTLYITRTLSTGRKVLVMVARSARLHAE